MAANAIDIEIRKFLPLLGNEEKKSLLKVIKNFLHMEAAEDKKKGPEKGSSSIDYAKYRYPVSSIKFNRDEINER